MLENPKANSSTIYNRCESREKELDAIWLNPELQTESADKISASNG